MTTVIKGHRTLVPPKELKAILGTLYPCQLKEPEKTGERHLNGSKYIKEQSRTLEAILLLTQTLILGVKNLLL